jgi:hypothetical protein
MISFPDDFSGGCIQSFSDFMIIDSVKEKSIPINYGDAGVPTANGTTPDFLWASCRPCVS